MMSKESVCIVTFPLIQAGYTPISNLVGLFSKIAKKVYLISGGAALENMKLNTNVQAVEVTHKTSSRLIMRIMNYVCTQVKILCYVITVSSRVDSFVFFIGGEGLLVPMLTMKLIRKKILLMPGGMSTKVHYIKKDPLSRFMSILTTINFMLANTLIVYSAALAKESDFAKYHKKLIIMHRHVVDFSKFAITKKIDERKSLVGYVGRLSEEKGILDFAEAIPLILKKNNRVHFAICGEGNLADRINKFVKSNSLEAQVKLTKWVSHDDVPLYLNELKLMVLPSLTEGLPNILLEAMACGTPVLATSVGAIPDIIKDDENGFLLNSNDPQHIADKIVELLRKPELLEKVSENSCRRVRENFSEKETTKTWQKILTELGVSKNLTTT
jgi:glycosyltransferase involved in cell wall biosynthesis